MFERLLAARPLFRAAMILPVLVVPDAASRGSTFDVRSYGATGRKADNARPAIQTAVDACGLAGGGMVYFPPGEYTTGTIHLHSHVRVFVEAGAGQLARHELESYGFVHFTIKTFTDKEWGYNDESPALFDPTDFSADQIIGAMPDTRMAGVILTCKHHDGV
ncbi:MAG: hypothetical protein HXY20_10655 [Acidobacteria bacterium]|nr:hypothetical protein [Acidobacteriota bacterium]